LIDVYLYLWNDNYKEEKDFIPEIIKIDRNQTLKQIRDKILEIYNFQNTDNLYIFKKMDLNQNSYTINQLRITQEELDRSIILNCIYENTKIYIELIGEDWKQSPQSHSKFAKVINLLYY